jgi:hypothetical protein
VLVELVVVGTVDTADVAAVAGIAVAGSARTRHTLEDCIVGDCLEEALVAGPVDRILAVHNPGPCQTEIFHIAVLFQVKVACQQELLPLPLQQRLNLHVQQKALIDVLEKFVPLDVTPLQRPVTFAKVVAHGPVSVDRIDLVQTNVVRRQGLEELAFGILPGQVVVVAVFCLPLPRDRFGVEYFGFLQESDSPFPWTCHKSRERNVCNSYGK